MKKVILAILFSGILSSFSALAGEDHDHDDHGQFPEDVLLVLEGVDAVTKEECFLFVTDAGYQGEEKPENYRVKVQSSYSHGDAHSPEFVLSPHPTKALVFMGQMGTDTLAVQFANSNLDLREVVNFSIRWLHGNHYHTNRCQNLAVHAH